MKNSLTEQPARPEEAQAQAHARRLAPQERSSGKRDIRPLWTHFPAQDAANRSVYSPFLENVPAINPNLRAVPAADTSKRRLSKLFYTDILLACQKTDSNPIANRREQNHERMRNQDGAKPKCRRGLRANSDLSQQHNSEKGFL